MTNNTTIKKRIYNVKETGIILGIGKSKVYELINHGYLNALDLGGLKVTDYEIDKFLSTYNGYDFKDINNVKLLNIVSVN